jgi:hypothetical protein
MNDQTQEIDLDEQLQALTKRALDIEEHSFNIKVTVESNDEMNPYPFTITTETDIPVMAFDRDMGRPAQSDFDYNEAKFFLQGLCFGIILTGNWQE